MVFREGRKQGVQRLIATRAMDMAGKMNMDRNAGGGEAGGRY